MDQDQMIARYGLGEAIEDGVLVPVFASRWRQLSGGKPIVATLSVSEHISHAGLVEIWNDYVRRRRERSDGLPEADRLYTTQMYGRRVWVIEDGAALTILYPEDY